MIYAIEHRLGLSLIEARTPQAAIRKAEQRFGTRASPFIIPEDQAQQIACAKALGAGVY